MILGNSEGDAFLASLGVRRLAIPLPFKAAGGPLSAYLIDEPDGSLTLWDTGLGTDEGREALEQGFAEAGRRIEDVRRILLSHGHVDHYGLAAQVQRRSGAKVFVHVRDHNKVVLGCAVPPMDDACAKLGVPAALIRQMAAGHERTESLGERVPSAEALEEGRELHFARFKAQVLHCPGHSPGEVCLHVPEAKLAFTGDHLLAKVTPNPVMEPGGDGVGKYQALVRYTDSARRLYAMDLDWIAPGHGEPFRDHRRVIENGQRFHERRLDRIVQMLASGPRTAFELVQDVFGEGGSLQLFLMLSEVVGNLEMLELQGRVRRELVDGRYRYEQVGA